MDTLLIFKILQSVAIVVFAVFISDIRKKDKSVPLIDEKFLRILKISYLIPLALYGYVLFTMSYLSVLDIIALSVTALGTLIAALAKINLAGMHTWTGYCKENTNCFFSKGIYRYMRHPLYTGIFDTSFGMVSSSNCSCCIGIHHGFSCVISQKRNRVPFKTVGV
jgi:protein-S-isoprenylcysteine O-methyltransferase Ste14